MPDKTENQRLPIPEDVVGEWLNSLDVSPNTKHLYRYGMRAFQRFLLEERLDFDALRQDDIVVFKHFLENRMSPSAVSGYLSAIRSFYRWAEPDGIEDVAHNVKGVKIQKGFKKDVLSPEKAREMLSAIDRSTTLGMRNFAIVNLMIRTGLRDIEVVRANTGDIEDKIGAAVLNVQGKGHTEKDAFVVLERKTRKPIEDYLAARERELNAPLPQDAPLFASCSRRNRGGRLTTRTISGIVKQCLANVGIVSERYTAHSLRHTAITYSLLGGATVQEAKEMARHASIDTTLIYAHNLDRVRNAAELRVGSILDRDEAKGSLPNGEGARLEQRDLS